VRKKHNTAASNLASENRRKRKPRGRPFANGNAFGFEALRKASNQLVVAKRVAPPVFSQEELLGLARYDAMLIAIAECQEVDEAKEIHDKAKALELYAKEAQNYEAELRAMDVRIRAAERAGALIAEGQKNGTIVTHGGDRKSKSPAPTLILDSKPAPKSLSELGISRDQSSQWQQLAGIPAKELEEHLPLKTGKRTSPERIIRETKPKPDPQKLRQQKLATLALNIWGRVRDVSELAEDEPLHDIVGLMDQQILSDLKVAIPKAHAFLASLEKEMKNAAKK
jgi:hypothetical protein